MLTIISDFHVYIAPYKYYEIIQLTSAKTKKGRQCKIPFRGGKKGPNSPLFYKCTKYDATGWWCATTINDDKTYASWDWC